MGEWCCMCGDEGGDVELVLGFVLGLVSGLVLGS